MDILTPASASAYIVAKHADHGGATVLRAVPAMTDNVPVVRVAFQFKGRRSVADVWFEGGALYGEW